jgi:hypothetical protein
MGVVRNLKRWWQRRFERCPAGTTPLSTPHCWLREPENLTGRDTALFVAVCHENAIAPHTARYINALAGHGWRVVVSIVVADIDSAPYTGALDDAAGIFLRENEGFDFGAWSSLLERRPDLWRSRRLLFANDSLFGPFDGFPAMIEALREADNDIVSLTRSRQIKPHFQSFFFMLQHEALDSQAVRDFWRDVRNLPRKWDVSRWYEVELLAIARRSGLSFRSLFAPNETRRTRKLNPSIHLWRELVVLGFPFVKVSVLRDDHADLDLTGWRNALSERGADVHGIEAHLLRVAPDAPALRADRQP